MCSVVVKQYVVVEEDIYLRVRCWGSCVSVADSEGIRVSRQEKNQVIVHSASMSVSVLSLIHI